MTAAVHPLSAESSRKIGNLAFLAAIAVCASHVNWFAPSSLAGNPALGDVRLLFGYPAQSFFFAASGFFMARRFGEPGWWRTAIRRRIGTIVVPFCVWQLVNGVVWFFIEGRWTLRPGGFGLNPFVYPKLVPLWYLRNLMLLVVASPLVFWCLRRWGWRFVAATFVAWFAVSDVIVGHHPLGSSRLVGFLRATFSPQGLFAFGLGACLAWRPVSLSRRAGAWCGAAATALACAHFALRPALPVDMLVPASCLAAAFAWAFVPSFRLPEVLSRSAFPVYLMHGIVINSFCWLLFERCPFRAWLELLFGVGGPIAACALLRRLLPRAARFAFGGR